MDRWLSSDELFEDFVDGAYGPFQNEVAPNREIDPPICYLGLGS